MDEDEPKEKSLSSGQPSAKANLSLQQAINFGEYDPKLLQNFAEWHTLSIHIQWELIRKALEIRHRQLITQYAELNNALDFSKKPYIHGAMKNVEKQLEKLRDDKEKLYVEYSNKIYMDYKTKTNLILPFKGTFLVSNGGRDASTNNHFRPADQGPQNQLYAYDFRTENTGKEKNLEDYPIFGAKVLAPGNGVIIQVINGSIDVLVGERDRSVGVGNAVIIDHQNGEYSLICHFKHNSIKVKVGDKIKQRNVLGLCGNTGNTTQPHIHFNLQDGPRMHNSKALPVQFSRILVDGIEKVNFEPIRGQKVSNI